jgi:hypothetical protein
MTYDVRNPSPGLGQAQIYVSERTGKTCTVKPAHTITCIKKSPFSFRFIENFIWIEPILRSYLPYKDTCSLFQRWPLISYLSAINSEMFDTG